MKFTKTLWAVLVVALCIFSESAKAQDDVIRVDTDLVMIPAIVTNSDRQYVTNLKKEDFQIFEDGIEQEIELFETIEAAFTIFFLIDRGRSMTPQLGEAIKAANSFFSQLRPEDELIAASFAENVDLLLQPTKVANVKKGIKVRQNKETQTYTFYAVDYAIKKLKKVSGRKAIVLFSDGLGIDKFVSAKDNLRNAEENEIIIYTIQFKTPWLNPSPKAPKRFLDWVNDANEYMQNLAQKTGGRSFQIDNISNLEVAFNSVAEELGKQYSLGYYPKYNENTAKNTSRQVVVKVRQPNLKVRAKNSYLTAGEKKK